MRFERASSRATVLGADVVAVDGAGGAVTRLRYVVAGGGAHGPCGGDAPSAVSSGGPGEYVFLNAPALSALAWHPFTLSSSPTDGASTHHIRAMGDDGRSFTARLAALVREVGPRGLALNVDGPYGLALDYARRKRSALWSGVTPMPPPTRST